MGGYYLKTKEYIYICINIYTVYIHIYNQIQENASLNLLLILNWKRVEIFLLLGVPPATHLVKELVVIQEVLVAGMLVEE